MGDFIISIFNMILMLLKSTDNIIIFVPFASLFISSIFYTTYRVIRL